MLKSDLDEIGHWSERKLKIVEMYASTYTKILNGTRLSHYYIDAFSGAGIHVKKDTGQLVEGSPLRALMVKPPFLHYHFIDTDEEKTKMLRSLVDEHFPDKQVTIHGGDCNQILPEVLGKIKYENYERALCLFDPYGIHLNWKVIEIAGKSRVVDMFLNFPIMDMNMNVLLRDSKKAAEGQITRMNDFWGDESWRNVGYKKGPSDLFGEQHDEKTTNNELVLGFQQRLKDVAGFKYVANQPMKNNRNAVLYYLIFAAAHSKADDLAKWVMGEHNIARSVMKTTGK